jgi:iron complex transport system substrate-binding protein
MQVVKHPVVVHRLSYLLLSVSLLLAAGIAPTPPQPTEQAAAQPTAITEEATSEEATPEDTEVAQAAGECEAGFRLFDHELLLTEPVCIPANPERVLPLDMASLEMTLLTGKTPVATAEWMLDEMPLLIPEFADILAQLEGVGYPANLEQVALLGPDLILAPEDTIDVEQASEIAPVIVPDPAIYEDWKLGMEFWAEALNMPDRYAEMEENYRTRVAELQSALGDAADEEISVISFTTDGVMLWMPDSAPGGILADAGLERPEAQRFVGDEAIAEYGDKQWIQISDERLDLADGDVIFYFTYASTDPEVAKQEKDYIDAFEQTPLWLSLDAVQAGQSYFVPGHWWRAQTYYLANKVIDDLFTNLTDTTATTPVLAIE